MSKFTNISKRELLNAKHPRPLPLVIPLSHLSNKYYKPREIFDSVYDTLVEIFTNLSIWNRFGRIVVKFDINLDSSFKIFDYDDMLFIWNNGFYGKGNLSRSEPTWEQRMIKKIDDYLNHNTNSNKDLFSEEITKNRRHLREIWKNERISLLKLEKEIKLRSVNGIISDNDKEKLELERNKLSKLKEDLIKGNVNVNLNSRSNTPLNKESNSMSNLRMEDYDVIIDSKNIKNIEYLQLDPCETIFLLQLDIISVDFNNINSIPLNKLVENLVNIYGFQILLEYVVYYHYKTLGWCVKNGLKFSCDWILYSRGPPFSHAEFSIKIVSNNNNYETLIDYSAISRVVSGVKKNLILCFVDHPDFNSTNWLEIWNLFLTDGDLINLLNSFTINEINWKRWTPSRTRM